MTDAAKARMGRGMHGTSKCACCDAPSCSGSRVPVPYATCSVQDRNTTLIALLVWAGLGWVGLGSWRENPAVAVAAASLDAERFARACQRCSSKGWQVQHGTARQGKAFPFRSEDSKGNGLQIGRRENAAKARLASSVLNLGWACLALSLSLAPRHQHQHHHK